MQPPHHVTTTSSNHQLTYHRILPPSSPPSTPPSSQLFSLPLQFPSSSQVDCMQRPGCVPLACNTSAARACRGCGWTWPCIGATSAAFAMIILHLPNSSGSGAFSVIQPHFLLSQLLKQRVPQAAEWLFVCLLAAAGVMGACIAATAHLKGDTRWSWWCCSCFVEVAVVAVAVH